MITLLTGSSGFFGSEYIKLWKPDPIITLGRKNSVVKADLSIQVPQIDAVDLVVHAAGKAHAVPGTDLEKKEFFNVNVTGTKNLLLALENAPLLPRYFVFISSVAVYGLETGNLVDEDSPLLAVDPYGKSKIEAEKLVTDWCKKNNVICTILRLPLLAGKNPPGNLKSMINGIKAGYYFNIAGGKAKKSMVMALDVAKIIPKAAVVGGIYNLTDQHHPSFLELSSLMAKQLGKKRPLNIPKWVASLLAKTGDALGSKAPINSNKLSKIISDLTFDDSKAQHKIGWKPGAVLEQLEIF
ncbi:NAD-dependent epimerase/dehydratase family protein [Mucilaginibacter xinganensis]|uniref:UDP-galactose-4-epimerase n=1 Tax=Mucilaginibacter xinganensis TaxID=1234841 RepID=A0A223NUU0_9SPHI|nr:NAD-dependent epimerase/dehydratase family protein [Mucilaginibacter xinganensis]ASU33655.1 UDP-galactose-4-epimerase [Mucilaginibacter xinganensis]